MTSTTGSSRREVATRMADAALALLDSLDADQRAAASWPLGDDERQRWFYTPTDHGGLPLAAMSSTQHRLTHRLVSTGLSEAGYVTAAAIIGLENVLDWVEGWSVSYERERGRDPLLYWIAIFGDPGATGAATWGWRFGGHHISLNYTIVDGELVSTTPLFFGADPASAPLLGPHPHRPLAGAEDLGRELVRSLDNAQRSESLVSAVPPTDLVTANRTELHDGDEMLGLPYVWRGRFEESIDSFLQSAQRSAEEGMGLTATHQKALAFTTQPKGTSAGGFNADQNEILRALLAVYLNRLPDELADEQMERIDGQQLDELSFLWAGSTEPGEPHYYRVQGADLLVEYDNTARNANHVHTVWRDLSGDFGRATLAPDTLADHYAHGHSHTPTHRH